MTIGNEQNYSS